MNINLNVMKKILKKIPDFFLYPLKFIPFNIFCGKEYRKQLCLLNSGELNQEEILVDYLNECIKFVPFYKRVAKNNRIEKIRSKEDLFLFPIITKKQIEENLDDFVDPRYLSSSYVVTTGGTTGAQTKLLMSNCAYSKEWAFVNYFLRNNGVDENSSRICLRGVSTGTDKFISYNYLYKELLLSPFKLNAENVISNIKKILKFNAKWIHGYSSSVTEFSRILIENNISINSIKHILLVSEKLYPEQKQIITLAFPNAKILTFYGMTERVIFASRDDSSKHFMPNKNYGITEIIDGELIGTGFINKATRLVRYKTGDLASVNSTESIVNSIISLDGRWGKEFMIGCSNIKITMTSLNIHSDVMNNVIKYQFYQEKKGFCIMRLMVNSYFESHNVDNILEEFQKKLGNELIITPEIVDEIPLSKRGKHIFIISDIKMD
ncbi:hypothetical protein [Photobacterium damselae]|uniref:hypothetical protein n=1 Tax=Photobacterium damselae TaxID=38293 RepID=UPI00406912CA